MTVVPASLPVVCDESVMSQKKHGTSETPVQKDLRWGCDFETADRICNFNRHYAGEFTQHELIRVYALIFWVSHFPSYELLLQNILDTLRAKQAL